MTIKGKTNIIELPYIHDSRGDLTYVEGQNHIPFDIKRVYFLYNVPVNSLRGGHAHKELEQVIFPLSGSFRLQVNDGYSKKEYWLREPNKGVYISRLIWRELDCFSQSAVCMVLASLKYDEKDYYRNYDDFIKAVKTN